jgi:hypothetical protein
MEALQMMSFTSKIQAFEFLVCNIGCTKCRIVLANARFFPKTDLGTTGQMKRIVEIGYGKLENTV